MNGPSVLAWLGDERGPSLWRVLMPFTRLQQQGYVAEWASKKQVWEMLPLIAAGRYQCLIMPRLSFSDLDGLLKWRHSMRGICVIYEADDDFFSPSIVPRQHATVEQDKTLEDLERQRQMAIAIAQVADGVTVTDRRLRTIVRQYTDKPVCVVPNAIDTDFWRIERKRWTRTIPHLTVGWSGGIRPGEDLAPVATAWRSIAERHPSVHFVIQGNAPEVIREAVPSDRLHALPWLPVDWGVRLDTGELVPPYCHGLFEIDIGCASVSPRLFNTAKTPIKLWEYTLAGAAAVVSPTLYGPYVEHGVDGLIAETADEWETALERLIEDPKYRRQLQRAQRRRVATEHSLKKNLHHWPAAWSEIYDDWRARQSAPRLLLAHV